MLGQTVPNTGSSNREGPIANGGQPCTTGIHSAIVRKASPGVDIGVLELVGEIRRYCPMHTRRASLNWILFGALSQCVQLAEKWSDAIIHDTDLTADCT